MSASLLAEADQQSAYCAAIAEDGDRFVGPAGELRTRDGVGHSFVFIGGGRFALGEEDKVIDF